MKDLDRLPRIVNEALGGLKTGEALKRSILTKARDPVRRRPARALAIASAVTMCLAAAAVMWVVFRPAAPDPPPSIHSVAAGQSNRDTQTRALLDLPPGSIILSSGQNVPEYRSVWAPKSGADFPLIAVEGRFYRLMRNPSSIPDSLLGDQLGDIREYTKEPSLSGMDTLVSNVSDVGETVYAVKGMKGALAAARVDGQMRVFQRISYAGKARTGKETLADTLIVSGKVTGIELSGKGAVTDASAAAALVGILLREADYQDATLLNAEQSLLIQLDNGLTVQMLVKGDLVSACGSWSCPEFFEAFDAAVR